MVFGGQHTWVIDKQEVVIIGVDRKAAQTDHNEFHSHSAKYNKTGIERVLLGIWASHPPIPKALRI